MTKTYAEVVKTGKPLEKKEKTFDDLWYEAGLSVKEFRELDRLYQATSDEEKGYDNLVPLGRKIFEDILPRLRKKSPYPEELIRILTHIIPKDFR